MVDLPVMHDLKLSDKEYNLLVDFIYQKCGINLGDNKKELVKARLTKRLRFHKFKSFMEYYEFILQDSTGNELVEMVDAISTNVTSFCREKQHFDYLKEKVLPEMIGQKRMNRRQKIRIWCAASSTGE